MIVKNMRLRMLAWAWVISAGFYLVSCRPASVLLDPEAPSRTPFQPATLTATPSPVASASAGELPVTLDAFPQPMATLTPSLEPESIPTQTATPAVLPMTHYHLQAGLDFSMRQVSVIEEISYVHTAPEELKELVLVVEANRYPGSFQLTQLLWGDGQPVVDYQLGGNRLNISLPQPAVTGSQVSLVITYELDLPEIPPPEDGNRPQPFGYTSRQVNLVDWYPYLPPYRPGAGWLVHDPWYFGEHQVYAVADYDVEIHLEGETEVAGQPILIAASSPARVDGNTYTFQFEKARSFAWSASPVYQVLSEQVGDVTVQSYAFTFHEEAGRAVLEYVAQAVRLYSDLFGSYPHASLSVVEADFLDGMEYDGLFFLSRGFYNLYDGKPSGYLTAIAVHETAHQWWYGLVGNDQALEPWLDEALCTYSEELFYEYTYPELVDWWWSYRVDYYQPTGPVNGSIYEFDGFRPYRDAVYLRGAIFMDALRQAAGDEAFFAFLQDYAARFAHQNATSQDFFAILQKHTSADLSSLKSAYFEERH